MSLNSIEKLRIWCQKVLPLVYDDSLSYYEVLTKVVNKLNEVIALAQEQNETIEEALSDIDTFETDMTSQFESYKTTLNAALDAFEAEITTQQSGFEGRMTQEFADFLADYEREFGITNLYGDSTTLAISQNQVSKLLDYTTNNNRFNPEVITSGKAIDNTGAVVDSANTAVTGYIEVQPGENIVAQAKNNTTNERYQGAGTGTDIPLVFDSIAGYDEDLTFVAGSYKSLVFNYQVPVGVKYIKLAMGQTILDGTNTDMSELAIVNSDGTIYPYQPYSEQNATVKMNALPVDDTTVGNHLWTANKINQFQAAVEGEFQQLETDLTGTVQGAIGDMNTAFTQKSAELDTKFDNLEGSIQAEQEAFETEIEGALASQKTELETEIGEVASDVQTLSDSVATQGQTITNLTGIVTSIDGRVDTLETDMAAAKGDISDLEASDAQQSSDITDLKGRMTTAEGEIDTLQAASEEHTTAISNLQAKDAELVGDINGLTTRVGSTEGDIDLLEGRADALETDVDNLETDVTDLEENKADKVGYEKDLNVGAADMLIGNGIISDNKAYNFRRTGAGNQNVGNRETDEIIGGTLVVNQLARAVDASNWDGAGATFADGVAAWTPASQYALIQSDFVGSPLVDGHVYLISVMLKMAEFIDTDGIRFGIGNSRYNQGVVKYIRKDTGISDNTFNRFTTLGKFNSAGNTISQKVFIQDDRASGWAEIQFKEVMVIDITRVFSSSTIADYVYNKEVTTALSGITWLYEYFPILNGGYIPYNTGTLQSIVLSKRKLTEFNQWDEEWENSRWSYDASGTTIAGYPVQKYAKSNVICNKNPIHVLPNTTYYFECRKFPSIGTAYADVLLLDENLNFLRYEPVGGYLGRDTKLFVTTKNTRYIVFNMYAVYGNTYNNDICINFSGIRNGEYEPYISHEYALDSSKELRGVPRIDSNGKLYFYGDSYKDNVTRLFVLVDMSTLNWRWNTESSRIFECLPPNIKSITEPPYDNRQSGAICSEYPNSSNITVSANMDDKSWLRISNYFFIRDTSYDSPESFKIGMTGKMLAYEIAVPTTEEATPVPNPQICSPDGTEEYIDPRVEAGTIPFAIPTGHETVYNTSLDYKLNRLPEFPTAAGVYKLQVTVTSGVPSYSWVAEV